MIVCIRRLGAHGLPAATLEGINDLDRLHVEVDDVASPEAEEALERSNLGHFGDSEIAWLSIRALTSVAVRLGADTQAHASPAGEPASSDLPSDWSERFDRMVNYAKSKGWCSPDGEFLQAHVVRPSSAQAT